MPWFQKIGAGLATRLRMELVSNCRQTRVTEGFLGRILATSIGVEDWNVKKRIRVFLLLPTARAAWILEFHRQFLAPVRDRFVRQVCREDEWAGET